VTAGGKRFFTIKLVSCYSVACFILVRNYAPLYAAAINIFFSVIGGYFLQPLGCVSELQFIYFGGEFE